MTHRLFRLLPGIAGFFVVICIAVSLAHLTWTLAGVPPERATGAGPQIVPNVSTSTVNMDAILAFAPFGTAESDAAAAGSAGAVATTFTLEGILLADDPAASQAIITTQGGHPKSYVPGEALPGGAVLVRVENNQVILRVNGREQRLTFPAPRRAGDSVAALIIGPNGSPATRAQTPIDEVIVQARQRITQNPQTLLDELGVQAGDGGYRIGPTASAMTRRAGFRPGDVVTKVNGVQVGNIESDRRLFEDVVESGSAKVEIVRDGKVTILTFPLR